MKKYILVLVLSMGACSVTPPKPTPETTYKHELINNPSKKEMEQNDIEVLLEGTEWFDGLLPFISTHSYKFTYDPVEGKRVISTYTNIDTDTVTEYRDSYKIEKDVWGTGKHRLYLNNQDLELGDKPKELFELWILSDDMILWNIRVKDADVPPAMTDEIVPHTILQKK